MAGVVEELQGELGRALNSFHEWVKGVGAPQFEIDGAVGIGWSAGEWDEVEGFGVRGPVGGRARGFASGGDFFAGLGNPIV